VGHWWNYNEKETAKYSWKNLSHCHVVYRKFSICRLKNGHGFGVKRPAKNCLSYGKAVKIVRGENKFSFYFFSLCESVIVSCGALKVNVFLMFY